MHIQGESADYDGGRGGDRWHSGSRRRGWGWQESGVGVAWEMDGQQRGDMIGSVRSESGLKAETKHLPSCTG